MEFAKRLRELRIAKELTQKKLGELIGYADASIRDWELKGFVPDLETIIKLAKIFDVTVGQLIGTEELII